VTLRVPEDCTDDLRRFARELRTRQRSGPVPGTSLWQAISPSAETTPRLRGLGYKMLGVAMAWPR